MLINTLQTPRLVLRQATVADAKEVFFLRSQKATMEYIPRKPAQSIEDAIAHIEMLEKGNEEGTLLNWGITLPSDDKIIGMIGFFRMQPEHFRSEVGYILHPDYQKQGIMKEALTAVLRYGFEVMGLHSITAVIDTRNVSSYQLVEKLGFRREGQLIEDTFWNGEFSSTYLYAILKRDFEITN